MVSNMFSTIYFIMVLIKIITNIPNVEEINFNNIHIIIGKIMLNIFFDTILYKTYMLSSKL